MYSRVTVYMCFLLINIIPKSVPQVMDVYSYIMDIKYFLLRAEEDLQAS